MPYGLAEAAQATGLNRSTVLRAIKSGRISGTRDDLGAWSVEPVELHRVFPPAEAAPSAVPQPAQLRLRCELAEARLEDLKDMVEELRAQRDAWQTQAERLALPKPSDAQAPAPKVSLWRWLRSTG